MREYIKIKDKIYTILDGQKFEVPPYIVTDLQVEDDFSLLLTFVSGEKKIFDMKSRIQTDEYYKPLADKQIFKKAHIEGPSVAWTDAIDIAPETLYKNSY